MAARGMDFRTVSLDPGVDCPASQVTDFHIAAAYDDLAAARELAERSDVVTYEFENVDATAIERIAELKPVYPSPSVLRVCQDREIEKNTRCRRWGLRFRSIGLCGVVRVRCRRCGRSVCRW